VLRRAPDLLEVAVPLRDQQVERPARIRAFLVRNLRGMSDFFHQRDESLDGSVKGFNEGGAGLRRQIVAAHAVALRIFGGKEALMKSPLMGRRLVVVAAGVSVLLGASVALAEPGTQSELTAVSGQGSGFVSTSPTAEDHGNLFIENEINIHDALPNTTYAVQRAVDFNAADVADGVCAIAPGPPFGWLTEGTLTTSPGGAGATHVSGPRPPKSGTRFDIIFRVINHDGSQLLMSRCMTITVK
jgi:hypothetical protein